MKYFESCAAAIIITTIYFILAAWLRGGEDSAYLVAFGLIAAPLVIMVLFPAVFVIVRFIGGARGEHAPRPMAFEMWAGLVVLVSINAFLWIISLEQDPTSASLKGFLNAMLLAPPFLVGWIDYSRRMTR